MLIVCPNCTNGYDVRPEALGRAGRKVRCARCGAEWLAVPSAIPLPPSRMELATASAEVGAAAMVRSAAASVPPASLQDLEARSGAADESAPATVPDDHADLSSSLPTSSSPLAPPVIDVEAAKPLQHDIEQAAASRVRRPRRRRLPHLRLAVMPTIIAAELLTLAAIVVWRAEVVRAAPATAVLFRAVGLPVNLRNLAFSGVHISSEVEDGVTLLVIEGTIENPTRSAVAVPRLRFALRNAAAAELLAWTMLPEQRLLGAGEALQFRSRLASPPADGSDVLVRFIRRQDIDGGR
jgi:predicted Zn finger-like uncharacterized protein